MKRIYYFMAALLFCVASINAQVKIGNNNDPHEGAILDLQSTKTEDMGVLFPRVTLTSLTLFAPVAGDAIEGMIVYNANGAFDKGLYVWNGKQWKMISEGTITVPATELPKVTITSNVPNVSITNGSTVILTANVTTTGLHSD